MNCPILKGIWQWGTLFSINLQASSAANECSVPSPGMQRSSSTKLSWEVSNKEQNRLFSSDLFLSYNKIWDQYIHSQIGGRTTVKWVQLMRFSSGRYIAKKPWSVGECL